MLRKLLCWSLPDMPIFPLLVKFSHCLSLFRPSSAGFIKSRFCSIIKIAHFWSPNGLFQAQNAQKRGRLGVGTPLGKLTTLPQIPSRLGRETPYLISLGTLPSASFSFWQVVMSALLVLIATLQSFMLCWNLPIIFVLPGKVKLH